MLSGLRKQEDSWIFEEPVTEDIAPGYFEIVDKPMDFLTVEKKIESGGYTTRDQVNACLNTHHVYDYYVLDDTCSVCVNL